MDQANHTATFHRTATFHKPNKTGRAWYIYIVGAEPAIGEQINVIRRDGRVQRVIVRERPTPHRDGWLAAFHHVDKFDPTVVPASHGQAIPQPANAVIDGAAFLGSANDASSAAQEATQATQTADLSDALRIARETLQADAKALSESLDAEVNEAVKTALEKVTGRVVYVDAKGVEHDAGRQHKSFARLLKRVSCGFHVWLPGPAGSGKTTAAEQVAKVLGLKFWHQGKVMFEHSLLGYRDAMGNTIRTVFREAWEHGGVMLLDECDSSEAKAMLAVNMIEQSEMAFPDGIVKRHPDFRLIAAANTYGLGGDSDYVGRNKLDGAFLDRFITVQWDYDEEFEMELSGNPAWCKRVQRLRANAKAKGLKVLITPRASIKGAIALAAGIPQEEVEQDFIRKGMTDAQWQSIQ